MRYKVNRNRPLISPEEIAGLRNFRGVRARFNAGRPLYRKPWFYTNVFIAVAATAFLLIFLDREEQAGSAETTADGSQAISGKAFISPPLPGVNINYSNYRIDNSKGGELVYGKSKIIIPPNALVDEKNTTIEGDVEILYREFQDVVDFFVSGIPMTYDSAGNTWHFESAGMMEILAYKNGKPVFIHPQKKLEVRMASSSGGSLYNLYYLDTVSKNWECRGKDSVVAEVQAVESSSGITLNFDTVASEERVENKPEMVQIKKEIKRAEKEIAEIEKTKPAEPRKLDKKKYNFNIEVDPKEFPELALYKNVQFEVGRENKNFSSKMYKTTWESAALSEKEKGLSYTLTLTKGYEKHSFVVYPVFEGKSYEEAQKAFSEKFQKYNEKLAKRQEAEKKLKEEYEAKLQQMKEEAEARQRQYEEQQKRWEEERVIRAQVASTENEVLRVFYADRFGVYNCDAPQMYPKGEMIAAEFSDDNGVALNTYRVFLAEKGRKAIFTYYDKSGDAYPQFRYNPSKQNICWAVTLDNKVAVYSYENFAGIPKNPGRYNFRMKVSEKEVTTIEELKSFLDI